jgi:hypothetical protein
MKTTIQKAKENKAELDQEFWVGSPADTVRVGLIKYALISIYPWFFTVSCLNDNCVLIGIVICNCGKDFEEH